MQVAPRIMYVVYNEVHGDSRVIKTAQAALHMGAECVVIGVSRDAVRKSGDIEGVPTIRLANPVWALREAHLWGDNKNLHLLMGLFGRQVQNEAALFQPDIVHSHDMHCIGVGAGLRDVMLASGKQTAWIHDIHEFVAGLKGDTAQRYMPYCLAWERDFYHTADQLITVSDMLADTVRDRYHLPVTPTVTYNVPNMGEVKDTGPDMRSTLGLAPDVPLIAFVGGANALRGCDTMVEAVSRLDGVHLAFVSKGVYAEDMKSLADKLGMRGRFHLLPYVASNEVSTFVRTADMGIHGLVHYPNGEVALPNKLFEYLHAGLPVAVSDVASMKAFVEKHKVGAVYEASNAASCAAAIQTVLSNRAELKANIRPAILRDFSWETQEGKLTTIYRSLLGRIAPVASRERREASARLKLEDTFLNSLHTRMISEHAAAHLGTRMFTAAVQRLPSPAIQRAKAVVDTFRTKGFSSGVGAVAQGVKRRFGP